MRDTIAQRKARGYERLTKERDAARAELASLRATVAALTTERDAAYRRGWDAASHQTDAISVIDAAMSRGYTLATETPLDGYGREVLESIKRDIYDHRAATLEAHSYIRHLLSMSVGDRYNEICKMRDDKDYFLSVLGTESK